MAGINMLQLGVGIYLLELNNSQVIQSLVK